MSPIGPSYMSDTRQCIGLMWELGAAGSYQSRSLANLPSFSDAQKSVEVVLQTFLLLWAFENRALWWWIFVACPRLLQPQVSAFFVSAFCILFVYNFCESRKSFYDFSLVPPWTPSEQSAKASRKRVFSMKWSSITFAASRINHGNTKMFTWKSKISCIATYWVDPTRCLRIFCIPSHNIFEL